MLERTRSITGLIPVDRQIALVGSQDRLLVVVDQANALALGRSLHQGQRHRCLKNFARLDDVVEEQAGLGFFTQHFEYSHARTPIATIVVDEHIRQR